MLIPHLLECTERNLHFGIARTQDKEENQAEEKKEENQVEEKKDEYKISCFELTNQIAIAGSQDGALQIIADPSSF